MKQQKFQKIGMFQAMRLCKKYEKSDEETRAGIRKERLETIVSWARENSIYYNKLYQNLPRDYTLNDLPPVNKIELMKHWEEWCTDSFITLTKVNQFMENLDNVGRKVNGNYLVFTTSGSTGNPMVLLCDPTVNNVMGAINARRAFARKEELNGFIRKGGKTIGVFATKGFYLSNVSVRSRLLMMPWKKKQMAVTSALLPTEEIVKQLNDFQPAMLGGYSSNLELLIEEQKSGRLHIAPVIIMTGGEYLSDDLRQRLTEAFHCYVQTSYSCTEGGAVACECKMHHFHINDDWVLIEAVDKENHPVADGELSDHLLLTNYYNQTQPLIRYEVTDRIRMHHEACSCGNPSCWLEIEGRNDDVVTFEQDQKTIQIPPLAIYATLKEIHTIRRFQLVVYQNNGAELRLEPMEKESKQAVFDEAERVLKEFFATYGVNNVTITLSKELPMQHPISGKFKHIINQTKMV